MLKLELLRKDQRLRCSRRNIQCIIGLIIFYLIILFIFRIDLKFNLIFENSSSISSNKSMVLSRLPTNLLLLYEKELFHVEKTSFRPIFHNHHLTLKLNLTTIAIDYLKNNSIKEIHQLNITCLQSSKHISNDFNSICEIYLTFYIKILNQDEVRLILLSKNNTCLLSLTNTSDIISIDIHKKFSRHDRFRFTYQWSHFNRTKLMSWPKWPVTPTCLNNLIMNQTECSLENILIHSTSTELFIKEQNAVSHWLDLQYKSSIDERDQSINIRRRLAPFEIAKNCSIEFQNWILKYRHWHENISFILNNGSPTLEEQRNRIIKYNVRFLIYEKESSGIADGIIHLISTYFVALLTNRLFIFDKNWPEFFDVLQSSLNYEQKLIIPWFSQLDLLNKNLSRIDENYLTFKKNYFSLERYKKDYDYEKDFPERILLFKAHTGGVIHTIQSNKSIYKSFLINNLKMNSNQIFGCLYHSFLTYRLSFLIKTASIISTTNEQLGHLPIEILQILLSPKFNPIGIQIRVGDRTMTGKNTNQLDFKNFQQYFTCAEDLISKNEIIFNKTGEQSIAFLLSDSQQLRQSALKQWKFPMKSFLNQSQLNTSHLYILSNSNPVFHIQYTNNRILAFQLGMFDIFLFSLCEQHIISTESGFGRFPAFASLKQRNIYSFFPNEKHRCQNEGLSLDISGHHWSGI